MTSHERHVLGKHSPGDDHSVRSDAPEALVQLREEELAARTQQVQAGQVVLGTDVVEDEQTLQVPVAHEQVTLERHPVVRRGSDAPISASPDVVRVPVHEEQVSVTKQPVVYEEVHVGKHAHQETRRVSEMLRKEVVDVDATGEVHVDGEAEFNSGPSVR